MAHYWIVFPEGEPEVFGWSQLLELFSTMRAICVSQPLASRIAASLLEFSSGEMVAEALPSLDLICLEKLSSASFLEKFTSVRQLSDRPVMVADTVAEFDQRLECYLEK